MVKVHGDAADLDLSPEPLIRSFHHDSFSFKLTAVTIQV